MTESSELPRQIFRPSKPRASLSSLPSSSSTTTTLLNKENTTSTLSESGPSSATRSTRRKRAQSLGGEALDSTFTKRTRPIGELSPSKQARRGLVSCCYLKKKKKMLLLTDYFYLFLTLFMALRYLEEVY